MQIDTNQYDVALCVEKNEGLRLLQEYLYVYTLKNTLKINTC